jgi:hypothetical protein
MIRALAAALAKPPGWVGMRNSTFLSSGEKEDVLWGFFNPES